MIDQTSEKEEIVPYWMEHPEVCTSKKASNEEIEEINIDETRKNERYSLIIYFVKPGDTLWNIAKRFRSTVSKIVQMNGIEDENRINIGEKLFIPIAN